MIKKIIIFFLLLVNLVYAQERSVSKDQTIEKNGRIYVKGESIGYTGIVEECGSLGPSEKQIDLKEDGKTQKWLRFYKDGRLHKFSVIYYTDCKMWARGNYMGNKGETIIYFTNGKVSERINYTDDKLDGEWTTYSQSGKKLKVVKYKNGQRIY